MTITAEFQRFVRRWRVFWGDALTKMDSRFESGIKRTGLCSAAVLCLLAAGCAMQTVTPVAQAPVVDPKLGVAPSSVVAVAAAKTEKPLRKGGGRYQIGKPYQIAGNWYRPKADPDYNRAGTASWYGPGFHGRLTANGEIFDMNALTAAHPTMPLPSYARVTNLGNDRSVIVRVNDRGPFAHNRLIDLSKQTAQLLGFIDSGTAKVRVEYIEQARLDGQDSAYLMASYTGPDVPATASSSRPVMTAYVEPPRDRSNQVSGHMPARQAGFDTASPLSSGKFVRGS
jgi:rare lipoprotein A